MVEIPTEALEAAARALFEHGRVPEDQSWDEIQEWDRDSYRDAVRAVAPHLIAEGRRQAAREIATELDAMVGDDHTGTLISQIEAVEIANRIAEGGGQ